MVLGAQGLDLLWIGPSLPEKFTSFSKEFLESCRRNNFHESSGLVCGIPESMRNAPRFQNIVAWVREEDRVTDPCSELAPLPHRNTRQYHGGREAGQESLAPKDARL